jgi:TctA family transporter
MAEESFRQSLLLSHGHFDILFTRPLATALLILALAVMVLPAVVPPVKRLLGTVGEETGT